MTDTAERLAPALAGRYVVERRVGEGGMATVYLARDVRHHRSVAIKVLHPELSAVLGSERFLKEIELTAGLQHPHILPLFDSGAADGLLYYVMPYVEGESLRSRITRDHQLPIDDAVRIACDVASALEYAHKRGVVHRDIKPENILLYEGRPVVADFGIALAVENAGGTRITQTGMSLGTPHYMAPEQAMGERNITPHSDIYALGAVLYEMLVGEPPFTGPTSQAVIARVVTEEPRSLTLQRKTIPLHVEAAVHTALAKIPADRFASAARFAEALARTDHVPLTTQRTVAHGSRRGLRVRALAATPWVLSAVAFGLLGFVTLRPEQQQVSWQRVMLWRSSTPAGVGGRWLALSADGRTMAFVDTVGGRQQIWLKEDATLDPIPVSGTDNATAPAFSPDGSWIVFAADGKVKKVPRLGGAAITLSDSVGGIAGGLATAVAWADNRTVLFTSRTGALLAVSEDGGRHESIVGGVSDTLQTSVVSITALSGGGAALVGACDPGCVDAEVRYVDLRTRESRTVAGDALKGWYVDGQLIFVRRDGAVFASQWNPREQQLRNAPVPVLEGVRTSLSTADMAISQSGTLAYIGGPSRVGTVVEPVWVSRSGQISPIDSGWSFIAPPNGGIALSRDGRRLAVGIRTGSGEDIWIKTLDRGPLTRLTFDGRNPRPVWTPDGALIAYTSITPNGNLDVRIRRADGTGTESTLIDLPRPILEVEFTRDPNQWIVRVAQPPTRDILLIRRGDTAATPLVASPTHQEAGPALSPNGRWLAYTSDETGRFEVYVRPFPDVNAGKWQVSRNGGTEAAWAHSGRELFFRDASGLVAVDVRAGDAFATGQQRMLFPTRNLRILPVYRTYAVSPDDRRFIFLRSATGEEPLSPVVIVENWISDMYRQTR
ncbi:MAG TPA: protein kinase [Gemmatimonadaceae bacterium]|nr:protein kinase [Gemmatimonadaceae bacterium]